MRTYTAEFIVKDWNELTTKQQEEVTNIAWHKDSLMNMYSDDEGELFDIYIDRLKDKYKDLYDDITLDWSAGTSQGPYVGHRGWDVDLHKCLTETVNLSDVGVNAEVDVTLCAVYPDNYEYVRPYLAYMDVELDYPDELDIEYSEMEDLFEESANGKAFLKKWAEILSKPLEEYWDICEEYARGFQSIDEWMESTMTDGYLRAVYSVDEDGNEEFVKFMWDY